ncbi:hypothetical protein ACI2LO_10410 [Streptomyces sp. NPDC033754]|uniref:hypothetical protein n=1 Tax=unclassified Streptomyces TaxID=2593676 RepID=UPI0033F04D5F
MLLSFAGLVISLAGYLVMLWHKRRVRTEEFRAPATRAQETFMTMVRDGLPLRADLLEEARQRWSTLAAAARRASSDSDLDRAVRDVARQFEVLVNDSVPPARESRDETRRRVRRWEESARLVDKAFTCLFDCLDGRRRR